MSGTEMVTMPATPKPTAQIDERLIRLNERFSGTEPKLVWALQKTKQTGWSKVPRTLPLVMVAIDLLKRWGKLTGKPTTQGQSLTVVYLDLWCQQDRDGDGIVTVNDVETRAMFSGLSRGRGQSAWRKRVKLLDQMGFIKVFATGGKPVHSVLLMNPHLVIQQHAAHIALAATGGDRVAQSITKEVTEIAAEILRQVDSYRGHDRILLRNVAQGKSGGGSKSRERKRVP